MRYENEELRSFHQLGDNFESADNGEKQTRGLKVNLVIRFILHNVAYCKYNRVMRQVVDDYIRSSNVQPVRWYILPLIDIPHVCIRWFIKLGNTWSIGVEKFHLFRNSISKCLKKIMKTRVLTICYPAPMDDIYFLV